MRNALIALLMVVGLVALTACESKKAGKTDGNSTAATQSSMQAAPGSTPPAPATKTAAAPAKTDLVPIPLELPKPRFSGTPKNLPPGTRVKITEGIAQPRAPFLAPKGVTNVALHKPVTASDMEPVIGTLDLITDGSKEAVEDAYVELGPGKQWVQIDLGADYDIYAIVTWHEHKDPRVYKDVVIQVADDKDFITNVRTVFNNDDDNSSGLGIGEAWEFFETNEGQLVDCKDKDGKPVRAATSASTPTETPPTTSTATRKSRSTACRRNKPRRVHSRRFGYSGSRGNSRPGCHLSIVSP